MDSNYNDKQLKDETIPDKINFYSIKWRLVALMNGDHID